MRLENDLVRIVLDPKTGGFQSIFDKKQEYEYILAPDRALLFRLMTPEGDLHCRHVDGASPVVELSGNTATLTFDMEGVKAIATLTLDESGVTAILRIENRGVSVIEEVMFPWVRGIGPAPGGAFVWPCFWRRRIDDVFGKDFGGDHHTWNEWTQKLCARYPAHLATAWCDYGAGRGPDTRHGIGIEGRQTDFSIMDFFAHKVVEKTRDPVRRTLDLVTAHPRRVKPGETYTSSPVRILVHQGDWHVVADAHRQWLESWIRKPDRPERFARAIGWHFFFMKHQDGLVCHTYEDLPRMAQAALDAGCNYLLVFGWQTGGHDNNYFYRYVPNEAWGGADALRRGIENCRAMGVEIMPFFNGTLANVEMPEHKEFGHRWEAKTRTGHPYYAGDWARHNFDALTRNRAMLHTEIGFCKEQVEYFLASIKRVVQDYGFGNTQLDQIAEKMLVDYDAAHVTTTPDRVYVDGLAELLPGIRKLIREVNPEGVMISEALNDFTGQWCDSSWDWTILFPFPEPILYSLPWLMASHEIDALEYDEVNKAFVYKMHLDLKIDGGDAPVTKYPAFARHVRVNAELRRRVADQYAFADFRDEEGLTVEAPPGILAKVYLNREQGKLGIVVAETAGAAAEAKVRIEWKYTCAVAVVESNINPREILPIADHFTLPVQPHEVRVICLDGILSPKP